MLVIDARGGRIVPRLLEVTLADEVLAPRILGAAQLALSRLDRDVRKISRLLIRCQFAACLDALPLHGDFEAGERRLLALQLVAQLRALQRRDRLIFFHDVTGLHQEVHGARCCGEHSRADCRHDEALRGEVANERTASHFGNADAFERHGDFGGQPVADEEHQHQQQQQRPDAGADDLIATALLCRGGIDRAILRGGIAHRHHFHFAAGVGMQRCDHRPRSASVCRQSLELARGE